MKKIIFLLIMLLSYACIYAQQIYIYETNENSPDGSGYLGQIIVIDSNSELWLGQVKISCLQVDLLKDKDILRKNFNSAVSSGNPLKKLSTTVKMTDPFRIVYEKKTIVQKTDKCIMFKAKGEYSDIMCAVSLDYKTLIIDVYGKKLRFYQRSIQDLTSQKNVDDLF